MRSRTRQPSRAGFTLVELMVSMALIIFIMYILAEAFSAGAKTFRDLKAVGDMNTRLRVATSTLRRLLAADHFEGRKRLSDTSFWDDGPPKSGFFRIWQDNGGDDEGVDLDSAGGIDNHSYRSTTHHLHFTARLRGNQRGDFFTAQVPPGSPLLGLPQPDSRFQDATNQYTSPWAEVAVYLRPTDEETADPNSSSGGPLRLHTLHLRQRLLVPGIDELNLGATPPAVADYPGYTEVGITRNPPNNRTNTSQLWFNSPQDVTMPIRRFGPHFWNNYPGGTTLNEHIPTLAGARSPGVIPPYNSNPATFNGTRLRYSDGTATVNLPPYPTIGDENPGLQGSDVLLTDVLSFDVRVLLDKEAYDVAGIQERFISLHERATSSAVDPITKPYWMEETGPARPSNTDLAKIQPQNSFRVFDTWSQRKDDLFDYTGWLTRGIDQTIPMYQNDNSVTKPIRIRAIQITIRIWDHRTKQSRQVSIVQDM
jgi:type II secretory pathway pseudopilin PulG